MATASDYDRKISGVRGRPPYGYRLVQAVMADGSIVPVLEPDAVAAPVVRRIFEEYANGRGLQVIAESLTADGILCPSAYDRARNPHFRGVAWSKGTVRAILVNRRYTEQRSEDTVPSVQEPLIEPELVARVHATAAGKRARHTASAASSERVYRFRGLLRCGYCSRVMQGTWNNGEPYYRCRFPEKFADANGIAHPRNAYLRERRLLGPLHRWLVATCSPRQLSTLLSGWPRPAADREPLADLGVRLLDSMEAGDLMQVYQRLCLKLTFVSSDRSVRTRVVVPNNQVVRGRVAL